jgi:sirohydrochlorin cobaltochelatase
MKMPQEAIVLFAHGARDPEWAGPAMRVAAEVQRLRPDVRVQVAFLEFMEPTLGAAVEAAAASGVRQLRVVPLFLAQGAFEAGCPALIEAARARHPGCSIELLAAVGEDEGVVRAMAAFSAGV